MTDLREGSAATQSPLPGRAQLVIIDCGIIGCSVAYHLTRRGITDVLALEQGTLTCGTTWHAAGLVSQLKATHSLTKLTAGTSEIEVATKPIPATASIRSFRDPRNLRVKV